MIGGFAVMQRKLNRLNLLMVLGLSVLFLAAIVHRSLQLSDFVALLFALFVLCSRRDISAYQVPQGLKQILILLLLFSLYKHLIQALALLTNSPVQVRPLTVEAAYVAFDGFAALVCWRSYQLMQLAASIFNQLPDVVEVVEQVPPTRNQGANLNTPDPS